jgi:hypothetical protein
MDGPSTQWIVVEQQHGLLCCLGVAEGDEAIALQTHTRVLKQNSHFSACSYSSSFVTGGPKKQRLPPRILITPTAACCNSCRIAIVMLGDAVQSP